MKVSIITATFNSAAYIATCIDSVNKQTYPDIEHIIIDGASSDDTLSIVDKCSNRINKIISEPDTGIYDALNKGIQNACGDLIAFLHADDAYSSETIVEEIVACFTSEEVCGVYGDLVFVDHTARIVRSWKSGVLKHFNVLTGWMFPHPTLVVRKSVYEKYGYFDPSFHVSGDYDFMLRIMLSKQCHLHYLPKVVVVMRLGGASTDGVVSMKSKLYEDIKAVRKNGLRLTLTVVMLKKLRKIPQLFVKVCKREVYVNIF